MLDYNSRMHVRRQEIRYNNTNVLEHAEEYQYNGDGSVQSSQRPTNPQQERKYVYDQMGRIVQALTAEEARGETVTMPSEIPFAQNYGYDAFGNLTSRTGKYWGQNAAALSDTYVNHRNSAWTYDAQGNLLQQLTRQYTYDAAGQNLTVTEPPRRANQPALSVTDSYDGDGRRIKRVQNGVITYQLHSTAMGGVLLTTLNAQGNKMGGNVYANGSLLATQSQATGTVTWLQDSPDGNGKWISFSNAIGTVRSVELDPLLNDVGVENPSVTGGVGGDGSSYPNYGDPVGPHTCALNDNVLPCDYVMKVLGRDHFQMTLATISRRIGSRTPVRTVTPEYDGSSIAISASGSQDEATGKWTAAMTVAPGPDVFNVETTGSIMTWATMRSMKFLYLAPQKKSGFNLGNVAFTGSQQKILDSSYNRINQDDCRNFINDTLAKHKVDKQFNSLDKLLTRTRLSYYDTSRFRNYSPSELGLDTDFTLKVRGDFLAGAVTVGLSAGWILSYWGNKYETEARDMERRIRDDLIKSGNPCP